MKMVFDTNVILSALITHGLSSRVLDICIDKHQIFISPWILNEVIDKLENKFSIPSHEIRRVKNFLKNIFILVNPTGEIPVLCRDIDDNNILHLADYINADIIITGDKDLLILEKLNKTEIINPRRFMEKYY